MIFGIEITITSAVEYLLGTKVGACKRKRKQKALEVFSRELIRAGGGGRINNNNTVIKFLPRRISLKMFLLLFWWGIKAHLVASEILLACGWFPSET